QNGTPDEQAAHPAMSPAALKDSLNNGIQVLFELLGEAGRPRFVRGPFGLVNDASRKVYEEIPDPVDPDPKLKHLKYVFWTVSADDLTPEYPASRIQVHLRDQVRRLADKVRKTGQKLRIVVQLHDTSHFTAAYLPDFLTAIKAGGSPYRSESKKAPKARTPV